MRRRSVLAAMVAPAAAGTAAVWPAAARADYTTTPDPGIGWGVWEGWGTSLAWWANVFGDRNDIADALFTTRDVTIGATTVPGLGMNIVRYNLGGCSRQPAGGASMVASPKIPAFKQIEGYWLNWNSSDPASPSWNWYADSKQRNALWKARDRGVNHFELFSDSPMWWMCTNHNPSGAADGGNNLQSWNYLQHAVYLATVARYAKDRWGFQFTSMDAFNEPSAPWWKADGTQEGCHVDAAIQAQVIGHLKRELSARGLSTVIAASDETSYDQARATWAALGAARAHVGKINVHGYQYEGGRRDLLYTDARAAGKRLWQSEYGDGDATGLRLAVNLNLDMRALHPTAWVYWQALDGADWGMITVDEPNAVIGAVRTKYSVMAQYSRHIRPGMRIIESGDANTVAAYDQSKRRLVLVSLNRGPAQYIGYDLSAFGRVGATSISRWATDTTEGGQRYSYHTDTVMNGTRFWSWFNPGMVQTFQIENVDV
ncbi:glycoside hydrolase [Micromonospora sp. CA-263727]|uniref:glycoside hydrolase n=1 Tax=Micromonospora sp. CA-263727 TaxID=3239967 RepID=UPI003D8CE11F